jgi:hypothetical protein
VKCGIEPIQVQAEGKQIASGGEVKGDTTTLENFNVVAKLMTAEE